MDENKVKDFFRNNIIPIIIAIACLAYIARGLITINETGKTPFEIIGDGALALLFSLFITQMFGEQGFLKGDQNERVVATNKLHGETVDSICGYINLLDEWCDKKNSEALKKSRRKILSREGMKYEDYFDEQGNSREIAFDFKNKEKRKKELKRYICYRKALRKRITPLTVSSLTSGDDMDDDPYNMGKGRKEYRKYNARTGLISKIATSVLAGCYGVNLIANFSWAEFVWTLLQVALFLLMGAMNCVNTYFFVTDELRARTIRQINELDKFKADVTKEHNIIKFISEERYNDVKQDDKG